MSSIKYLVNIACCSYRVDEDESIFKGVESEEVRNVGHKTHSLEVRDTRDHKGKQEKNKKPTVNFNIPRLSQLCTLHRYT